MLSFEAILPNYQHKLLLTSQYEGYIEAAQNFIRYVQVFAREWAQKTHLAVLVLKRSVLKQSLPNSQFKLLGRSQFESYIEATQKIFMSVQFSIGIGHKKLPSLNWF